MKFTLRNIWILSIVFVNAGCDQVTKNIARNELEYEQTINVIGDHLVLMKVENTGAFLSTGHSLPEVVKFIILSVLPLAGLLYGIYFITTRTHLPKVLVIGIGFVIGGGLGNLTDRLFYGSVTDFIHIDYSFIKTGIFNLADVSIMIGVGILLVNSIFRKAIYRTAEN